MRLDITCRLTNCECVPDILTTPMADLAKCVESAYTVGRCEVEEYLTRLGWPLWINLLIVNMSLGDL